MDDFAQVAPPSWVTHSSGPNAQPSLAFANRRAEMPVPASSTGLRPTVVLGAGMGGRIVPPSVVWTIAGQRPASHGTLPRTQPTFDETKVAEIGAKPAGT